MNQIPENIPPALINSYKNTIYKVFLPALEIKINELHPELDTFLIDNNVYQWAFISACNPYSQALSELENEKRHLDFQTLLAKKNYVCCEGEGKGIDSEWPAEKSCLILDISLSEAILLAKQFEQNAIVYGQFNQKAQLILCRD